MVKLCNTSPPGYRDYGKYLKTPRGVNHLLVSEFWSQEFLGSPSACLPTKNVLKFSRYDLPTYYVSLKSMKNKLTNWH